jgi:tetratricopeptide (TPR) repeat protein
MSRVFLRMVLLAVIGSAAAPARGSAQPAAAPVDKKQVARQYTEAGLAAAKLGDYDTAINFYQKAYQLLPHPTLIFNIAEAQRFAGRIDLALSLYRRYLSDAPAGPQAQDARDRIAEIEARKAEDARKVEEARKAEDDRKAAEHKAEDDRKAAARKAEDDRRAAEAREVVEAGQARERAAAAAGSPSSPPGAVPPDTGAPEAAAPPGRNLRIAGIATGAGGVAGVVIGIGFAVHSSTLNGQAMGESKYDPGKDAAGRRANAIAYVGAIGGTALVAAGAAMYWWGYTQGRSAERVSIAPVVSDRLAGLAITGTWR